MSETRFYFCTLMVLGLFFANGENYSTSEQQANFESLVNATEHLKQMGTIQRYKAFQASVRRHQRLNAVRISKYGAVYGVNKFSYLEKDEFRNTFLGLKRTPRPTGSYRVPPSDHLRAGDTFVRRRRQIPIALDWRKKKVLTPIKVQQCSDCWAQSIVESMEAMTAIKYGISKLTNLSVQQLVDCAPSSFNERCHAEYPDEILWWMYSNKINVTTNAKYPYFNTPTTCLQKPKNGTRIRTYQLFGTIYSTPISDNYLTYLLASVGPLVVHVAADSWQDYIGGVIQTNCYQEVDHVVQLVGYNMSASVPYYIIRNTWGTDWGIDGYAYIQMGNNMCNIRSGVLLVDVY